MSTARFATPHALNDKGFWRLFFIRPTVRSALILTGLILLGSGCSESGSQTSASKPAAVTLTERSKLASMPATSPSAPQTKPAETPPVSSYDSHPPYPVILQVRAPDDPQPGWLHIDQFHDKAAPAGARGSFPEQNIMVVDTQNVRRIEVQISELPLSPTGRLVLRIDGQGIELIRDHRRSVTLVRSPVGAWSVVRPPH